MANKTTKDYDWNPFVRHASKVMNEEAGVNSPASAAKEKKPYYVSINGNLTDVNDPEWVKRAADAPRPVTESAKPKIVKGQIGNVKYVGNRNIGHESWDQKLKIDPDTKQHVMKEEYESNKYKRPMSSSGAILREIISDDAKAEIAKQKATKPISIDFSNDLRELEAYQQSRIEADERARRFAEQIKRRDDGDIHRGLATILNYKK